MRSKTHVFTLIAGLLMASGGAWAQTNAGTYNLPHDPPIINLAQAEKVASGITVIADNRVNYVPNIGIIEGEEAILVVDTGLGKENGAKVYTYAKSIAGARKIYVTTTHFHPEHSFGVSEFKDAIFVVNRKQAQELAEKGQPYLQMFRNFGAIEKQALKDAVVGQPSVIYDSSMTLDLGGKQVQLLEMPAHTQGDQVIYVDGVVFLGDLVENRFFPIMPDKDSNGEQWINVLDDVLALKPVVSVPGHGTLGDASLVKQVRDYLITVRDEVNVAIRAGKTQEQTLEVLSPKLKALHPDWDNSVFIPYEISVFYAELSGKQLQLPNLLLDMQK